MDATTFDRITADAVQTPTRRAALSLLVGGVVASLGHESTGAIWNGKKRKRKKKKPKGCNAGMKDCFGECIPEHNCCHDGECSYCALRICKNGQCDCPDGWAMGNGACAEIGFTCKSIGFICTSHEQCCSKSCSIYDGLQYRCSAGTERCIIPIDCVSGECRGFMCPEYLTGLTGGRC